MIEQRGVLTAPAPLCRVIRNPPLQAQRLPLLINPLAQQSPLSYQRLMRHRDKIILICRNQPLIHQARQQVASFAPFAQQRLERDASSCIFAALAQLGQLQEDVTGVYLLVGRQIFVDGIGRFRNRPLHAPRRPVSLQRQLPTLGVFPHLVERVRQQRQHPRIGRIPHLPNPTVAQNLPHQFIPYRIRQLLGRLTNRVG